MISNSEIHDIRPALIHGVNHHETCISSTLLIVEKKKKQKLHFFTNRKWESEPKAARGNLFVNKNKEENPANRTFMYVTGKS